LKKLDQPPKLKELLPIPISKVLALMNQVTAFQSVTGFVDRKKQEKLLEFVLT